MDDGRRSVELDERNFLVHCNLVISLLWNDRIDEAITEARVSIELYPNTIEGNVTLGHALAVSGELKRK